MVTPVPHAGVRLHRKAPVVRAVRDGALTDADFRGCKWIEGDPSPPRPGMFCGAPVSSGESWCEKRRGVVFGENSPAELLPSGVAEARPRDGGTDAVPGLARLRADTSTEHAAE